MTMDPSKQVKLGYISGLVAREKSMAFERILFRATRGNVFLKQTVLENAVVDPVSGDEVDSWMMFICSPFPELDIHALFWKAYDLSIYRLKKMYLLSSILVKEQRTRFLNSVKVLEQTATHLRRT